MKNILVKNHFHEDVFLPERKPDQVYNPGE
jgi:hypothetical protein